MKIFFKKNKFFTVKNVNHFSIGHKIHNSFDKSPNNPRLHSSKKQIQTYATKHCTHRTYKRKEVTDIQPLLRRDEATRTPDLAPPRRVL